MIDCYVSDARFLFLCLIVALVMRTLFCHCFLSNAHFLYFVFDCYVSNARSFSIVFDCLVSNARFLCFVLDCYVGKARFFVL